MERTALVVALLLTLGSVPLVSANHLSVGVQDGAGVSAEESPDDPSVPGRTAGDASTDYGVGTTLPADCYNPAGEPSPGAASEAAASDSFCGELIYHPGSEYVHVSSPDQDVPPVAGNDIEIFDVVEAAGHGAFTDTCLPWCQGDPAADPLWEGVHEVGSSAELTETADEADDRSNQRYNRYGTTVWTPSARLVVQTNADTWRMNGWMTSTLGTKTFVGFLEDDEGNTIDEQRLEGMVTDAKDANAIPEGATPLVCGFDPGEGRAVRASYDAEIGASQGSFCEVVFEFVNGSAQQADGRDYQDPCASPSYVCGASQSAWYARQLCSGYSQLWVCDPEDNTQYRRLHWVVAPSPSSCNGQQAPGFAMDVDVRPAAYLAHDLDVFVPPTSVGEPARGLQNTAGWGQAAAQNAQDAALGEATSLVEEVPDLPGVPEPVQEEVRNADRTAGDASSLVTKGERVEPNADVFADEELHGVQDSSQSLAAADGSGGDRLDDLTRELDEDTTCSFFDPGQETEETLDPWTNIIDSEVWMGNPGGHSLGNLGTYGNSDGSQDPDNQGTPHTYYTSGNLGMHTDSDDSGGYQVSGASGMFDVETHYPMFWDMRLDPSTGEPDPTLGCDLSATTGKLTAQMLDAGYGAATGLIQAVYLEEPTVFMRGGSGDTIPYPDGDTVFVMMSQSMRVLYERGNPTVASHVQELSEAFGPDVNVAFPGGEDGFDLDSDFEAQCGESAGGFRAGLAFAHACAPTCSKDGIVTRYLFTVEDGTLGGGDGGIPTFTVEDETFDFGPGTHAWTDVDPLTNDPSHNDDESDAPPT